MKIRGYLRSNGEVGIRNQVLIFPTVICAAQVAEAISRAVPGTVSVNHPHGCGHLGEEREHMVRSMSGFCANPNVSGVLLVGLGCELLTPEVIGAELTKNEVRFRNLEHSKRRRDRCRHKKGNRTRPKIEKSRPLGKTGRGRYFQIKSGSKMWRLGYFFRVDRQSCPGGRQ